MCRPSEKLSATFFQFTARGRSDTRPIGCSSSIRYGASSCSVGRRHLAHARQTRREAHEDEAQEDLVLERREAVARGVQLVEALPLRHADQAAVERVAPGVVGAGDALAAVAAGPVHQPRGAMAADVVEAAHAPSSPRTTNTDSPRKSKRVIVARPGDVAEVADHLPAVAEDRLVLALEELGVGVDPRRQAERLQVGRRGGVDAVQGADFMAENPSGEAC